MSPKPRFICDKLVRSRVPYILESKNIRCVQRVMETDEYQQRLNDKLFEEAEEVCLATTPEETLEEIGDVLEVLLAFAQEYGFSWEQVLQAAEKKRTRNGDLAGKIYVEYIEMEADHPEIGYYRARPHDYPEVK